MKLIYFVIIFVIVFIGELISGVFKVIFLVKVEVKFCNRRKKIIILNKLYGISYLKLGWIGLVFCKMYIIVCK